MKNKSKKKSKSPVPTTKRIPLHVLQNSPMRAQYLKGRPLDGPRFKSKVRRASRFCLPLRPGDGNAKMDGLMFVKGPFCGTASFYVSLREGTDCPQSCSLLKNGKCGAVNFMGLRFKPDKAYFAWVDWQIRYLLRQYPSGITVRLHVGGDFKELKYVAFWVHLLRKYPNLHLWGHTHHGGQIWHEIDTKINRRFPKRALIRASESGAADATHRAMVDYGGGDPEDADAVICPATLTKPTNGPLRPKHRGESPLSNCDRCGLCMDPRIRTILWPYIVNGIGYVRNVLRPPVQGGGDDPAAKA